MKILKSKTAKVVIVIILAIALLVSSGLVAFFQLKDPAVKNAAEYKIEKIKEIKTAYDLSLYEDTDKPIIDELVTDSFTKLNFATSIEEIDNIVKTQREKLDKILSIQGKIDDFIAYKQKHIDIVKNYDKTLYNSNEIIVLNKLALDFEKAVNKCDLKVDVDNEYNSYKINFDLVKTKNDIEFEKANEFNNAKMLSKTEINGYLSAIINDYYELDKLAINDIKKYAVEDMDKSKSVDEVNVVIKNAKAAIDVYKTKQTQATEYQKVSIDKFNKFILDNTDLYYPQQITEMTNIVLAYDTSTKTLGTKEQIVIVEASAMADLQAVEKKANALITAKTKAITDINAMRNGSTDLEIGTITLRKNIAKADIENSMTISEIIVIVDNIEKQINAILG